MGFSPGQIVRSSGIISNCMLPESSSRNRMFDGIAAADCRGAVGMSRTALAGWQMSATARAISDGVKTAPDLQLRLRLDGLLMTDSLDYWRRLD